MAKKRRNMQDDAAPSYETALGELEAIVRQLEDGDLTLEESLTAYEKGIRCLKHCHRLLRAAERKVSMLTEIREDGTAVVERFEETEMTLEEKQESRGARRSDSAGGGSPSDVDTQRGLF